MQYDIPYIADKQINCQTYYLWKIMQKKKKKSELFTTILISIKRLTAEWGMHMIG